MRMKFGIILLITCIIFTTVTVAENVDSNSSNNFQKSEKINSMPYYENVGQSLNSMIDKTNQISYDIKIKSGNFTPNTELLESMQSTPFVFTQNQYILIQFNDDTLSTSDFEKLSTNNVTFLKYIPDNTYMFKVHSTPFNPNDYSSIRWAGRLSPIQKIDPEIIGFLELSQKINVTISFSEPISEENLNEFNQLPIKIIEYINKNEGVIAEVNGHDILSIAQIEYVEWISEFFPNKLSLDRSNYVIGSDFVRNIEGNSASGVTVGIIDSGLQFDHPHFNSITKYKARDYTPDSGIPDEDPEAVCGESSCSDGINNDNDFYSNGNPKTDEGTHGVHVAGIISGSSVYSGRTINGVSNGANLVIQRVFNEEGIWRAPSSSSDDIWINILDPDGNENFDEINSADIISISWGSGNGVYDDASERVDEVVTGHFGGKEAVVVKSAGNGGATSKVSAPGSAKNAITVGASADFSNVLNLCNHSWNADPNNLYVMEYSSRGTDDGRIKPDILAPGSDITSTVIGSSYSSKDGTSMAAPHVSGVAAQILAEYPSASPALVKAFIINSAVGGGTTDNTNIDQGWGKLDAYRAIYQLQDEYTKGHDESTVGNSLSGQLNDRYYTISVPDGAKKLIITLVYSDDPGDTLFGGDLINDLDLYLKNPSSTTLYYNDDDINNVEKYVITDPAAGIWEAHVKAIDLADLGGLQSKTQDYAIAYTIIKQSSTPSPTINVYSSNDDVNVGDTFEIWADLSMAGLELYDVDAQIYLPSGLTLLSGDFDATAYNKDVLGNIYSGLSRTTRHWVVRADALATHEVTVVADYNRVDDYIGNIVGSKPITVSSSADTKTTTGTVSETHSCDSISVTATYSGDSDNDGFAELYYKPSSASSWIYSAAMTKGSSQYTKTILGLAENTNYDIYVDYSDFDDVIGTDPIYYQYTINTGSCTSNPPSTPILDNPGTTDADGSYRITWSYHTDATYYNLQEDTSSSFLSPTTYTTSVDAKSFTGKGNGDYYYRVQACNGFGCSDWSNTESITVSLGSISDNSYAGNIFGSVFEGDSTTVKDYTNGVYTVKVTGRYYVTSPKQFGVEIYKSGSLIATSVISEKTVYYFDNYNLQVFVTSTLYGPPFYGETIAINTKTSSAEVDAFPSTISIPQGSTGSIYFDIPSSGGAYDTFFVGGTAKDWVTNPSISTYGTSTNKLSYLQSTGTNIDIAVPLSTPPGTHTLFILASNGDFIENDVGSPVYSVKQVTINVEQANNLPNIPTNPTPQNGAINQPINPTLSWTGGDPDNGDSVTYSVYLDSSSNPTTKRCSSITSATCSIIGLNYNQQYYWQVVATDNQGASTPGPIWSFTTNSPPTASITSISPNPANYGQTVSFSGGGTDSDGSVVGHNWRSSIDGQLSTSSSFSCSALSDGTHTIYYKVMDNDNGWSNEVSQTLIVFPNIPPIASITSIAPNPVIEGQIVSFNGSGTDLDGSVVGHNWRSSINGQLSTSSSFSFSELSVGTHIIYYKVMDNDNDWSNEMPHILTVDPDVTPPTITINSPPNNTVVGEYTLDISGIAYDISGVSQILINGNPVSTDYSAPGEVSFNSSIQLRIGDNEIIITAIDNYANSGDKTLNVKLIRGAIVEDPGTTTTTWTVENFGGFHYDVDDDIGTEMLMINLTASISGDSAGLNAGYRTIDERELSYSTNAVTKYCKYWFFGSYNAINFMGEPYLSLLEGEGLSKVLIDSDDTYTVTTGDGIELQEGYVLNVRQVDIDGNKAYIELTKYGNVVDTEIVSLEMASPQLYIYNELSIGGEANVLTIMAGVKSVFRGTDTDIVVIEGIFQISDTLTSVRIGDTYGNMEVTDNSATHITMNNQVPIDLSQGSTVDIMGDMKFRVADGTVLRFHPMLEMIEPGTYEIRGAVVADPDAVGIEWNPVNFAGFYYDLDEDIGTEKLLINSSYYRTIDQNELIYSTSSQDKQFAYGNFGHYNVIGFMSDLYFVGYDAVAQDICAPIIDASQNGAGILAINLLSGQNLSKILIDTDDKYTVTTGNGIELQEGYVLNVSSIDIVNNDAILQLSKDGTVVDTKTVSSGGVYVYDELNLGAEANVPTIIAMVGTIFSGAYTDAVTFEGLFQISDTLTSVEPGNTYGIMEITGKTATTIVMENANSITLSKSSTVDIMGDIKFRVADADIIRFYPMVDYRIESPIYDIALPTLTIASPTNDTIVYTSSITITGTASDDTSIASIAVNGILAAGTTSWGVNVPLTEGENTINVVATDIAGNTATATINVTYTIAALVEIRGSVVEDPGTVTTTWTAENFGGFHYDIDADIGSEGLMINPTASISGNTAWLNSGYRTIDDHELSYFTSVVTKYCEYGFFGNYDAINFMAEQYLTLHAGSADGGLLKILIDSDDTYIVNTGDGIELKEGYVLNVRQVDIDGNKVLLELTKYGNVVDTEIVEAWVPSPEYFYRYDELSIGDETNVPTIMVDVKSVFKGTDTDMVTIEGIFQTSDTLTSVGIDDTYGNMEVVAIGEVIHMTNKVPINLSQGSTVDIMGDIKFRVADNDTVLRFYPMLEINDPGTHEIRGEIVQAPDTTGIAWNPVNFAGFYYDLDENIGTETLTINSSYPLSSTDRTINQNELIYSTSTQDKQFAYENFGHYTLIGFTAKPYFAGYNAALRDLDMSIINASQNGTDILDINFFEGKNLSRILIDTDEAYTVVSGDGIELQEGYVLNVSSIDILNNNTIIKLSKNGTIVDTKTVSSGDVYVYDELDIGGENNVPTIIARIDTVLMDTGTDMVLFKGLFQISDSLTSVDVSDTYGNMKITSNNATSIVMRNNWRIDLNKGSIKEIMDDIKFRVADDDVNLRFYPFVDAIIEDITGNFNTTTIDTTPPVINIVSPQNGTTVVMPVITITGTASDASDVVSVTVNGESAIGTTNWGADVTLIDGENNITIVATDDVGNTQSVVLTVYYNPSAVIISMGSAEVPSNSLITIPVSIANAMNITGISFDLFYNSSVVSVDSIVANNSFTGSSITSNVDNINGTTRIVLTNTDLISTSTQTPVIDVTFNVTGDFGSLTNLDLENVVLSNSEFNPDTPASVVDGLITVGINGDLNNNGYVDIGDVAKVAFMVAGKVPEELSADFNDNGYVDIGDAAKIAFYLAGKVSEL